MKRYKKLIILGAILVVAVIAVVVITQINEYKEKISSTVETIISISSDDVTALSWEYGEEGLSFHRADDSDEKTDSEEIIWLYDDDEAFPVDTSKINDLLYSFETFESEFTIEEVEDYSQYGLDEPMCKVTITSNDETLEVEFGNYSAMDEKRYVSIGDGKVYLASIDPTDDFNIQLSDMIKNDEIPDLEDPSDISFAGIENYEIYRDESETLSSCLEDVYFMDEDGKCKAFDSNKVESLLSSIEAIDESQYVTYNATEDELSEYGLDSPELTTTITYVSETIEDEEEEDAEPEKVYSTFTVSVSRSKEVKDADTEEEPEEDAEESTEDESEDYDAYVQIGDSKIIYKISSVDYEKLIAVSYNDLRHTSVYTAGTDQIEEIDVSLEGEDYSFVEGMSEQEDTLGESVFFYNDVEIDITDIVTELNSLVVSEFTEEQPGQDEEISLKIKLENENFPEVDIQLYTYDGTYCLAVLDGEPLGLVTRTSAISLIESIKGIVLNYKN